MYAEVTSQHRCIGAGREDSLSLDSAAPTRSCPLLLVQQLLPAFIVLQPTLLLLVFLPLLEIFFTGNLPPSVAGHEKCTWSAIKVERGDKVKMKRKASKKISKKTKTKSAVLQLSTSSQAKKWGACFSVVLGEIQLRLVLLKRIEAESAMGCLFFIHQVLLFWPNSSNFTF